MIEHGLNCLPFRSLLCSSLDIKLCSYRKFAFQTVKKVETINPNGSICEIMWLKDEANTPPSGICLDFDFLGLVKAHSEMLSKYKLLEEDTMLKLDFNKKESIAEFVSYFPAALQGACTEWTESYLVASKDQSLLQLLHSRMWVDGCHMSLFDLQTIFVLVINLKELYSCNIKYLLLLANSVEQSKLVDVFLYSRIEYHMGKRFTSSSKIFGLIQTVTNSRYKALLAIKLSKYKIKVDEDDLHKILLMLQNASNGSEQLEKIGLDEWISIARKQKWSEIGYLLQTYGSIGYYLGVLDNKGFKHEERKLREVNNFFK